MAEITVPRRGDMLVGGVRAHQGWGRGPTWRPAAVAFLPVAGYLGHAYWKETVDPMARWPERPEFPRWKNIAPAGAALFVLQCLSSSATRSA